MQPAGFADVVTRAVEQSLYMDFEEDKKVFTFEGDSPLPCVDLKSRPGDHGIGIIFDRTSNEEGAAVKAPLACAHRVREGEISVTVKEVIKHGSAFRSGMAHIATYVPAVF
eukprot:765088-Hanusia_phi.AAC.2